MPRMERRYWKKESGEWIYFLDRNEGSEPLIGQIVEVVRGAMPWKIIDVIWKFKPKWDERGRNVFDCFDVYVE